MASPAEFTDEQGRRYSATVELGRGVLTAVYKAAPLGAGPAGSTSLALKTVLPLWIGHPLAEARIAREREVSASIHSAHTGGEAELLCGKVLAGGRQFCEGRTRPFNVSVLLEGSTLAERLRGGAERDNLHRVLAWADDLLGALARVHAAGWVHRDVKPQNVFVASGGAVGGRDSAYLIDFGLAVPIGAPRGDGDEAFGTPAYVCPEVIAGAPVDPRADLYSVGLVLFELLCGQRPFASRDPVALLEAHLSETPPRLRKHRLGCSDTLDRVIAATLAKHPDERPPSAEALRALLQDTPEGSNLRTAQREDCAPRVEA
jgi:serine/threonine protein kinase